ncbi:MAG: hypothetical protein MUO97_01860 [Dehalococcoidia bacterium]|nr:hypothetical protein [Dehalococcoidia bacterium]
MEKMRNAIDNPKPGAICETILRYGNFPGVRYLLGEAGAPERGVFGFFAFTLKN